MKKVLVLGLVCVVGCFGAIGEKLQWSSGLTLLGFFEQNLIPLKLYYNLPPQDKELTAEVKANATYYTLRNQNGDLLQALIPISDNVQIHIYKNGENFRLDFIPIISFDKKQTLGISLKNSPYQDILNITNDSTLAGEFANIYKKSIQAKTMHHNDKIIIMFNRRYRLGRPLGIPEIKASMIEVATKPNYVFLHSNGHYYDLNGKEMAGFSLITPVAYTRISSKFSKGRLHPVLKIVRPHYGVDYAARHGTLVRAAADGRVVFAGVRSGYGKVIEIAHTDGLKTLYAHLSAILVRSGAYVKVGTGIGRVGNTGVSTGSHLHFGVYKYNQPINPLGRIRTTASELKGKEKKEFIENANIYKQQIDDILVLADWHIKDSFLLDQPQNQYEITYNAEDVELLDKKANNQSTP